MNLSKTIRPLAAISMVAMLFSAQLIQTGCKSSVKAKADSASITQAPFGKTPDGVAVSLFTLKNAKGNSVTITNYGGIVTAINVPGKDGKLANVVLGFDSLSGYFSPEYVKASPHFGALIGRYGNRIAGGKFSIDGTAFTLAQNDGKNHLHGGVKGYDKVVWTPEIITDSLGKALQLTYQSKDGEEGYPGNLNVKVIYRFTDNNDLEISYEAETDKTTPVNLTNHSYFNLAGQGDILKHMLTLNADAYTPVDATLIPTGEIAKVAGTPFDFTSPKAIGERIDQVTGGYDHNFVLTNASDTLHLAATVVDPSSGRKLEVLTTEPGIQFYTGNFLDGTLKVSGGWQAQKHYGFCLETQHFPDSPNKPQFPSTLLNPGKKYVTKTIYRFSVEK
jgi:aldose 1-epimerase